MDGRSVKGAAAYAAAKGLEKVFGAAARATATRNPGRQATGSAGTEQGSQFPDRAQEIAGRTCSRRRGRDAGVGGRR